jgi:molybdopterin converting factor small subunit
MITVKLYGLLRIESGIKQKQLEACSVKEILVFLADCGIPNIDLDGCVILVNGNSASKRSKLTDGDTVVLMSPRGRWLKGE